jgi:guanosine-3',5'-bis(diphosphate) 3'-pyrophosphohydrolase
METAGLTLPYHAPETPPAVALIIATLPSSDASRIETAYRFAEAAHRGHMRDEGTPYIDHPVRVATILWEELGNRDVDMIVAALNHDVLEDCEWLDADVLAGALGERATDLIQDVTKPQVSEHEKPERDRAYLDKLRSIPVESRLLKLADRIDNLRSIVLAEDPKKARRYLQVSREEFVPLALATDPVAVELVSEACDLIEQYLLRLDPGASQVRH